VSTRLLSALALVGCILPSAYAAQTTYDTADKVSADPGAELYFPFGEIHNNRYQLWFSSDYLAGNTGKITSISNFLYNDSSNNDQWVGVASWDVEIWASSTATTYAGLIPTPTSGTLTASALDKNLGKDAQKIYDGWITLTSDGLTFQTASNFTYTAGNLLLDYRIKAFGGGIGGYDSYGYYYGPTFLAHPANDAVAEVISNTLDSEGVYKPPFDYSFPLRTAITFETLATPVPEPEAWLTLIVGLGLVGSLARRHQSRR
jgi:hypothetical protein